MNILVYENNEAIIKENQIESKEIICPKCNENILIKLNEYKINLFNCKNNHEINNILLNKYEDNIDISKIICNNCTIKNKSITYNNEFYRCNICKINLCPLCKYKHNKNHKIINYDNKNYLCEIHNMNYNKYCKDCKLNICMLCFKEHKNHSIIDFRSIILNKEENKKEMNKLKEYINAFNNNIAYIIEILEKVKDNINIYYNIYHSIINNYNIKNINYEILYNIYEFNKYNNIIKKGINEIIKDDNINNICKIILNIFYQMYNNVEYNNKINYKFEKDPNELKYKYDITNTNCELGYNDIFEVFILYLEGHKNNINTVRYFINNKDYNEYLISSDINKIVIIWDITNNYNIKYQINTTYDSSICSCLLVFPYNNNDNYIITSTLSTSNDNDKSAIKIYSLNNGNFIKYISNTNKIDIYYLLS